MTRWRDPRWALILGFLGILAGVPLVQALVELREDGEVRALAVFGQAPTAATLRAYEHQLEDANWAALASRPWMQFAQYALLKDGGAKVGLGRDGWFFYKPGLSYLLSRPSPAGYAGASRDPVAAITDFRDQLSARGIHLVVVPVPNKEAIYPEFVTTRGGGVLPDVHAPRTQAIMQRLREARVEILDLFPVFAAARRVEADRTQPLLYLAQDTHWSPAGVALAARHLAHRLVTLGGVSVGDVEYVEKEASVRRLGDLVQMLRSPPIEARVEPESVVCQQVVRRDTGGLFEESPEAEILVMGDSFLRVFQRDTPGSAGFVAHLARELKQPLLSLVNDGGGATLVRRELRVRPAYLERKRVVIWVFTERDFGLAVEGWPRVPLP